MLGGGFISDTQKNNWISKLSENNTLFSEFSNNISYNRISGKNSFSFSVADRNLARIAFTGDLMKVALFGNYNYQGDTLLFDKTNLNLTRFQQVKIGYGREFKIQDKSVKVSTALSYLNGNQHLSFLSEKEQEIQNNNKNRSQPKYKGAEDIYDYYIESVVFIGNLKKNRVVGMGSGFVIKEKGKLKIITNWHVIDDADSLSVWIMPKPMVVEEFLINQIDSYSANLIKVNKTKDLALLNLL